MRLDEFKKLVLTQKPASVVDSWIHREDVTAFSTSQDYSEFRSAVKEEFPASEFVAVVGTGNWTYSLNPRKAFKAFDSKSDIDTVVVSECDFRQTWDAFRGWECNSYWQMSEDERGQLKRNSANIYSGFVTPIWLPRNSAIRFEFKVKANALSTELVGYRPVRLFFFRNKTEVINYYARGIFAARRVL